MCIRDRPRSREANLTTTLVAHHPLRAPVTGRDGAWLFADAASPMKPFLLLATSHTPDGAELTLHSHDSHFYLRVNRQPLMGTNASESEKVLAELACAHLGSGTPRVLIGGLGFGFTLRRVLELVSPAAHVQVAELLPQVVAWNREFLTSVNGQLLDDKRVEITVDYVFQVISRAPRGHYLSLIHI